jgi:hypothetical protein
MSPKQSHVPKGARPTSLSLTDLDRAAISWLGSVERSRGGDRTRLNDVLVDALWALVGKEGRSRADFLPMSAPAPEPQEVPSNITEMPKLKENRSENNQKAKTASDNARSRDGL